MARRPGARFVATVVRARGSEGPDSRPSGVHPVAMVAVVVMVVVVAACSSAEDPATRITLQGGATVVLPGGWSSSQRDETTVLRRGAIADERIEVVVVARIGYGIERTPRALARAVRTQAETGQRASIVREANARLGQHEAAVLEWAYVHEGVDLARRHWVVELHDRFVHVSCIGPAGHVPAACDAVAASAEEAPSLRTPERGR